MYPTFWIVELISVYPAGTLALAFASDPPHVATKAVTVLFKKASLHCVDSQLEQAEVGFGAIIKSHANILKIFIYLKFIKLIIITGYLLQLLRTSLSQI